MIRLFVGLDLPPELRARLAILAGGLPGARWVSPENYHITLRFIGEQPGHRAEEIDLALAALRVRGFTLKLSGVGSVSLARIDNVPEAKIAAFLQANNLFQSMPFAVEQFVLFSSRLGKERAVYTAEVEYALT